MAAVEIDTMDGYRAAEQESDARRASSMRILVEPSGYKLGNVGDAAMLQVTVSRLLELWPDAELRVIT